MYKGSLERNGIRAMKIGDEGGAVECWSLDVFTCKSSEMTSMPNAAQGSTHQQISIRADHLAKSLNPKAI